MDKDIQRIKLLQKRRIILNCFQFFPPCKYIRDTIDNEKQLLVNNLLDKLAHESGLYDRFKNYQVDTLNKIENRIWMFWYTGFDSAPPVVKKCVSIIQNLVGADLVLIDKYNLNKYFESEGRIKEYFEQGLITIQTFADILRCYLLCRYGGFWFDSTLFVTRENFISNHQNMMFFSIKHLKNDLLMKKKWNEYFTKGRWSIYGCGSGKDNPLFSFIYRMYVYYYSKYETCFDYFQTDYIWLYAYENFAWAKEMIDAVEPSVSCSYWLGQHLLKPFNQEKWNKIIAENEFQKLNWRKTPPKKTRRKQTYLEYFLQNEEIIR